MHFSISHLFKVRSNMSKENAGRGSIPVAATPIDSHDNSFTIIVSFKRTRSSYLLPILQSSIHAIRFGKRALIRQPDTLQTRQMDLDLQTPRPARPKRRGGWDLLVRSEPVCSQ